MIIKPAITKLLSLGVILALVLGVFAATPVFSAEANAEYPSISVVGVEKGVSIVLRVENAPANETFTVRIGKIGTKGIKGAEAGTFETGGGGKMDVKVQFPETLKSEAYLSIRIDGKRGYYAYNWFQNVDKVLEAATITVVPPSGTPSAPTVAVQTPVPNLTPSKPVPVFDVIKVSEGKEITIRTKDYPKDVDFTIRMGKGDTKGIGGLVAGTLNSGSGGTFEAVIPIPGDLKDTLVISIRLDGKGGWYSYNWFLNTSRNQ